MTEDPSLHEAIDRTAAAAETFVTGDPDAYTALWSTGGDVTIFGAFGDGVLGREELVRRLAWAAARFDGGELAYEPMAAQASGDLGYAVGIERGRGRVGGQGPHEMALRVTHVFRREAGQWRLVHRHADPITAVTPPTAVLGDIPVGKP
jgi:ketosteroid isomerase-like protein